MVPGGGGCPYRVGPRPTAIPKVLLVAGDAVLQEVACRVRRIHEDVLPARLRAFFSPSHPGPGPRIADAPKFVDPRE